MSSDAAGPHDRRHPDPHTMTPAEKLICEWEARHDVVARGGRLAPGAAPGAVQHYLSETHAKEAFARAAEPPHPHHTRPPAREPRPQPPMPWWLRPARG